MSHPARAGVSGEKRPGPGPARHATPEVLPYATADWPLPGQSPDNAGPAGAQAGRQRVGAVSVGSRSAGNNGSAIAVGAGGQSAPVGWSRPESPDVCASLPLEELFGGLGANCETLLKALDPRAVPIDPAKVAALFDMLKSCEQPITDFIGHLPVGNPGATPAAMKSWSGFTRCVGRLLDRLGTTIGSGHCRLDALPLSARASIAMGLGTLLGGGKRLLGQNHDDALAADVKIITRSLLAGLDKARAFHQARQVGDLLNLFNWISRGLKSRLLDSDDDVIRNAFADLLQESLNWSAGHFNAKQLGKLFTLLDAVVNFRLVDFIGETPADAPAPGRAHRGRGNPERRRGPVPPGQGGRHTPARTPAQPVHQARPGPRHDQLRETLCHFLQPAFLARVFTDDPLPLAARIGNVLKDCQAVGLLGPGDASFWTGAGAVLLGLGGEPRGPGATGTGRNREISRLLGPDAVEKPGTLDWQKINAGSRVDASNLGNLLKCLADLNLYQHAQFAAFRGAFWQTVDNLAGLAGRGALGTAAADNEQSFCNLLGFVKSALRLLDRLRKNEACERGRRRLPPDLAARQGELRHAANRTADALRGVDWENVHSVAGVAATLSALSWFDRAGMPLADGVELGGRVCLAIGGGRAWRDAESIAHASRGALWLLQRSTPTPALADVNAGARVALPRDPDGTLALARARARNALENLVRACAAMPYSKWEASYRLDAMRAIRWLMAAAEKNRADEPDTLVQKALRSLLGNHPGGGAWPLDEVDRRIAMLAQDEEPEEPIVPEVPAGTAPEPAASRAGLPKWKQAGATYRRQERVQAPQDAGTALPGQNDTGAASSANAVDSRTVSRPDRQAVPFREPDRRRRFKADLRTQAPAGIRTGSQTEATPQPEEIDVAPQELRPEKTPEPESTPEPELKNRRPFRNAPRSGEALKAEHRSARRSKPGPGRKAGAQPRRHARPARAPGAEPKSGSDSGLALVSHPDSSLESGCDGQTQAGSESMIELKSGYRFNPAEILPAKVILLTEDGVRKLSGGAGPGSAGPQRNKPVPHYPGAQPSARPGAAHASSGLQVARPGETAMTSPQDGYESGGTRAMQVPRLKSAKDFAVLLSTVDTRDLGELLVLSERSHCLYGDRPLESDRELPVLYASIFDEMARRTIALSSLVEKGDILLMELLAQRHFALVELLIAQKVRLDGWIARTEVEEKTRAMPFGEWNICSTLTLPILNGDLPLVERLIDAGCSPHAPVAHCMSPLFLACSQTPEMVGLLLKRGVDASRGSGSWTPLMEACKNGKLDIIRLLLSHGVDIDGRSDWGHTALYCAIAKKQDAVVDLLLHASASPHYGPADDTPLTCAIGLGMPGIVEKLLDRGASAEMPALTSDAECRPIHQAIALRNADCVKLLLARGAYFSLSSDVDLNAYITLGAEYCATLQVLYDYCGKVKMAPMSKYFDAQINAISRFYPFRHLDVSRPAETIPSLPVPGQSLRELDNESLASMLFARPRLAADRRADPAPDLAANVFAGMLPVVVELKKRQLTLQSFEHHGMSPLLTAVLADETEMALALIELKADIDFSTSGHTPVIHAAWNNNLRLLEAILKKKPDVNARCYIRVDRFRAIDGAIAKGHAQSVRLLLEHGASFDPDAFPGTDGVRLEDARRRKLTDVVAVLEHHMRRTHADEPH